jgi:hypothetical protein
VHTAKVRWLNNEFCDFDDITKMNRHLSRHKGRCYFAKGFSVGNQDKVWFEQAPPRVATGSR